MLQLLSNNLISPKSNIKLQRTHLINRSSLVWQPDITDKWRNRWIYNSCWAMCCCGDRPLKRKSVTSIQSHCYVQWSQAFKLPQVAFVKTGETRRKEEEIAAKENEMKYVKERNVHLLTNCMLVEQNAGKKTTTTKQMQKNHIRRLFPLLWFVFIPECICMQVCFRDTVTVQE